MISLDTYSRCTVTNPLRACIGERRFLDFRHYVFNMDVYEICGYHLVSMSSSNGEITFFLHVTHIPSSILRSAFFQIFTLTRFACYMNVNFQYTQNASKRNKTKWLKYDMSCTSTISDNSSKPWQFIDIDVSASKFCLYTIFRLM